MKNSWLKKKKELKRAERRIVFVIKNHTNLCVLKFHEYLTEFI